MLDARQVRHYLLGVERKDGQLGRRTTDEAREQQEIFGVGESERFSDLLPRPAAERQAGIDLEPGARSRR